MRVFVISAYPAVRAGLVALVRADPESAVVGEAAPAAFAAATEAGSLPDEASPEVVLADLDADEDVGAVARWLAALTPRRGLVALLPLSPTPDRSRAGDASGVVRLGAAVARTCEDAGLAYGLLRRDAATEEIMGALRAVGDGLIALDRYLSRALLADALTARPEEASPPTGNDEPLTARELEVLQLLAQGLPNKLIAQRLHISEHTAKYHVSAILTKLGAASRTEAVTLAARRGLLIL